MEVLRPSEIRFKQDSIKQAFQNGKRVNETAKALCNGEVSVNDFPPISVAKKDNKYYSFDNRRLYVFRVAEYNGVISHIKVRLARSDRFDDDTFTTTDDGRKVKVRYDATLPHCKPHWLPRYSPPRSNIWQYVPEARTNYETWESRRVSSPPSPPIRRIVYQENDSWSNPRRNDSVCSCTIL